MLYFLKQTFNIHESHIHSFLTHFPFICHNDTNFWLVQISRANGSITLPPLTLTSFKAMDVILKYAWFLKIGNVAFSVLCFVRVCLYVLRGHLLGKGWPLGSRLWCLLWVCHFPIGILGQVWYLIVSIPDLCNLTYFVPGMDNFDCIEVSTYTVHRQQTSFNCNHYLGVSHLSGIP